ncbi:hypothetical protein FNV43_RR04750 [Rhamnella rubrinervis]|uniref:COX assembly mitochondrial protein n=1 Tax=Rhamnella rubrinervis TaxID=2594499 RepID=A0A8K0HMJ5_9ROSA|nr:hypothetical protein FNV43_RR04750 [Rhamnella rubrinervis]
MTTPVGEGATEIRGCERLQRALLECHRRIPAGRMRESACRHLNRAMAQCLVSAVCPDECEAVQSLCSSAGTALKRSQCQQAQLSLSVCLSPHQLNP